jgi:hypothetical protein
MHDTEILCRISRDALAALHLCPSNGGVRRPVRRRFEPRPDALVNLGAVSNRDAEVGLKRTLAVEPDLGHLVQEVTSVRRFASSVVTGGREQIPAPLISPTKAHGFAGGNNRALNTSLKVAGVEPRN